MAAFLLMVDEAGWHYASDCESVPSQASRVRIPSSTQPGLRVPSCGKPDSGRLPAPRTLASRDLPGWQRKPSSCVLGRVAMQRPVKPSSSDTGGANPSGRTLVPGSGSAALPPKESYPVRLRAGMPCRETQTAKGRGCNPRMHPVRLRIATPRPRGRISRLSLMDRALPS